MFPMDKKYVGLDQDIYGITQLGRIVLDARVFGLIPETQDCAGWNIGQMQALKGKIEQLWDQYGNLPSALPPELAERHNRIYAEAIARAKERGWDAELSEDE
ncbi:MAG TPA: hypothetical protein VHE37_06940 [Nevskiaceae bacterium]|nr:hypothetical protein [Nevskiaceae bacterium]